MFPRPPSLVRAACSRPVVRIALQTSLFVGTVLNAVNNGPRLLSASGEVPWFSLALNYVVPYLVASYSAGRSTLRHAA